MIIGAVIISGLMVYFTYQLSVSFRDLTKTSEQQIELRKAALELMEASDYLTERVQRFTVEGDMRFLQEYFEEAFETNRREEAIEKMSEAAGTDEALKKLKTAMESSLELMNQEYYAMRLVIEAKGYTDYPELLDSVALTEEDKALSSGEKMRRATEKVLDDDYYELKDNIRLNMKASLNELESMAYDNDARALEALRKKIVFVRVAIVVQTILVFLMVWITSNLGIRPILNAVEQIKSDSPIPEKGANEICYLAHAYKKMYEAYKKSLDSLNFKASHDELTGAYNRFGYDLLVSNIDLNNSYMMLLDVDNFKNINDTYGHETGDKVLVRLVEILRKNFRMDDYICRIGGDEFVIFMVHSSEQQRDLIASKIENINKELENLGDGLPSTSISVGIVHGTEAKDTENLYEKSDEAMYLAKQKGKHTYSFYSG
jgi:diguanylate cyclase (GGDEF)-like protein